MSFISNMLSGDKGNGWQATSVPLQNPATTQQATNAYGQAQTGLEQQQAFLQALQGQNGIQNQSNVFNQLQGVANGTGPNPAQAMLNQATSANVANQAALMAGQRGAGSNVGLIARQAAQQGAQTQQQAAGQAATMGANQQLAALNQLGGMAGQQVSQQGNALQGYNQFAQNEQQNLLSSINQQNNANVAMQSNVNNANAGIAQINAKSQNDLAGKGIGGVLNGASAALGIPGLAEGGQVHNGPKSFVGQHLSKGGKVNAMLSPGEKYLSPKEAEKVAEGKESPAKVGKMVPGKAEVPGDDLKNDVVPAKLEEGGFVIPRSHMGSAKDAAAFVQAHLSKQKKLSGGKK